jgi:hypothetical protein
MTGIRSKLPDKAPWFEKIFAKCDPPDADERPGALPSDKVLLISAAPDTVPATVEPACHRYSQTWMGAAVAASSKLMRRGRFLLILQTVP